ncbi:MAG: hypothetical protein ACO1SV_25130 [Fimbriimonas sp.]
MPRRKFVLAYLAFLLVLYGVVVPVADYLGVTRGLPGFGSSHLDLDGGDHRIQLIFIDGRLVWPLGGSVRAWVSPGRHRISGFADGRWFSYEESLWRHENYAVLRPL